MRLSSNVRQRNYQKTLDSIYDAAFDPCAFEALAGVVARASQSSNCVIIARHNGGPMELSATSAEQARQDYLLYYGRLDVWAATIARAAPLEIIVSQQRIADRVLNSEDADHACHMWHPIETTCALTPGLSVTVGVNRAPGAEHFDEADKAAFSNLAGHVQRALQLRQRFQGLEQVEQRANLGFAVLDQLTFGVLITDADSRVVYVNAPAEELNRIGVGLNLSRGRVSIALEHQSRILKALVRSVATGGHGGAMQIGDRDGTNSFLALVTPMPQRLREDASGPGLALIALRLGSDNLAFCDAVVAKLYGLSPSESQVLRALAGGKSSEEIAQARGVKFTTIKSQLEAVIRKTRARNQRDLVRLLGTLPQISTPLSAHQHGVP